ncbi:MAG: bacteriocin transport accessory protein [Clostridia bacterium]|nr:bacteriocin transport accessory protein [Clostridia bacterium]
MKKIIAFVLIAAMLLSITACAKPAEEGETAETIENVEIASALELLNNIWAGYAEDEKFASAGGDANEENMTMDGPGKFGVEDAEMLDVMLALPASAAEKIDDAASLIHMMNANTFTSAAYHAVSPEEVSAITENIISNISNRHWICGFPEELLIMTVGDYVISAFGKKELLDVFEAHAVEAYETMNVVYREPIE